MNVIIENIVANPLISFVLALLAFILLFALLKGLIKLLIGISFIVALVVIYFQFFEEDYPMPKLSEESIDKINEWTEPVRSLDLNLSIFDNNGSGIKNLPFSE